MPHSFGDPQWHTATYGGSTLRALLARHDIGAVFRYLNDRGVSYSWIGAATNLTGSRVWEYAHQKRFVTEYTLLERIAEGLGIPRHWMGLSRAEPATAGPAPEDRPGADRVLDHHDLLAIVAAIAVGTIPADVDRWLPDLGDLAPPEHVTAAVVETVTTMHRRRDAAKGGGACLSSARGYAAWAGPLRYASGLDDDLAIRLNRALADLHNLVG